METDRLTVDARPTRLRRFARALRATFGLVVDVALPQLCASCREPVGDAGLCAACWAKLSFIAPPYCERLGIPFTYDPGPGVLSMEAIADPPAYHRARAAVRYDEIARTLVPFNAATGSISPCHGPLDGERRPAAPGPMRCAVPHWRRRWARFSQSALLWRSSPAAACAEPWRHQARHSRSGLSHGPGANAGPFRVPEAGQVAGRRLVLIDDVLTSRHHDAYARALLRRRHWSMRWSSPGLWQGRAIPYRVAQTADSDEQS
jgi:predicted amidophosphoribosyltransferase